MGEAPLTVRLFVQTQTYDIQCDPRQPAQWLLMQAKNIQRANVHRAAAAAAAANEQFAPPKQSPHDELEVLYNRTTRSVIDLSDTIGQTIASMDVVDARTLLQTPDASFNSAMFPWLRTQQQRNNYGNTNKESTTDGLFFQQLYAYTLIGNRTPVLASQRKERQHKDAFHTLLETYVRGSFDSNGKGAISDSRRSSSSSYYAAQSPQQPLPRHHSRSATHQQQQHRASSSASSDSSDTAASDDLAPLRIPSSPYNKYNAASPTSPSLSSSGLSAAPSPMDAIDNIFDIVFKQQSLGMKLGADDSKQFAIVKECIGNSEAARYPEIQHGVVILAVNGQEVAGLTLARILYRLREAPRPVVVRFGRLATGGGNGRSGAAGGGRQPTGTWG